MPEGPQEDNGDCWSTLQLCVEERGGGVSAPLKKPELCSVRELASLFLLQNEVFPVKNISVGIMFLGSHFLSV